MLKCLILKTVFRHLNQQTLSVKRLFLFSFYLFIYIVEFWSWIKIKNLNERYS